MTVKERLHTLVEEIPEEKAERLLRELFLPVALATAPYDDEPESKEELSAVARARADVAAGRVTSQEEVLQELGQ